MLDILANEGRRFLKTCQWSLDGWRSCWATEKSLRQWTVVNVLSVALAFTLDLSGLERGLIIAAGLMMLGVELMNTALETAINYISKEQNPLAKKAKDAGSAAVAISGFAALAVWVGVLLN